MARHPCEMAKHVPPDVKSDFTWPDTRGEQSLSGSVQCVS